MVTKFLLQVYVWKLHNSMDNSQEEGGMNESIDVDNNIVSVAYIPKVCNHIYYHGGL